MAYTQRRRFRWLSALPDHLLRRDWVGLGLEIAVVALGVLLAFQVDQWGERRERAQQERRLLQRLWAETKHALEETDRVISVHQTVVDQVGAVLATNDARLLSRYSATPGWGCAIGQMPNLGFSEAEYQEILATGQLSVISDPDLQQKVRRLVASEAIEQSQLQYSRELVPSTVASMDRFYRLSLDGRKQLKCLVNWSAAMNDPLARNAMVRAHRNHSVMLDLRRGVREALQQVHAPIACKLRESDCTMAPMPPASADNEVTRPKADGPPAAKTSIPRAQ